AGVRDLELRKLLEMGVDVGGEGAQQAGTLTGGDGPPGEEGVLGTLDAGVGVRQVGGRDLGEGLGGHRVDQGRGGHYIRSNPRASSQSVTAVLKAASSTSAMFV